MRKQVEVFIAHGKTVDALTKNINEHLQKGYRLYRDIIPIQDEWNIQFIWPMVKYEEVEDEIQDQKQKR